MYIDSQYVKIMYVDSQYVNLGQFVTAGKTLLGLTVLLCEHESDLSTPGVL